jgi:hypothetical protein
MQGILKVFLKGDGNLPVLSCLTARQVKDFGCELCQCARNCIG